MLANSFYHGEVKKAMDSNEQLAERVKSGNSDVLELWWRVRRFAYGQAIRWVAALGVQSGVTIDDLLQSAFLAFLDALERWEPGKYTFLAVYGNRLKDMTLCGRL